MGYRTQSETWVCLLSGLETLFGFVPNYFAIFVRLKEQLWRQLIVFYKVCISLKFLREQFLKISFSLLSQSTNFLNKEIACLVKLIKELKLYAIVTVLDVGVKIISYLEQLLIFSIKVNRIAIFTSSPGCWIISQVTKHEICSKSLIKHISQFRKSDCWNHFLAKSIKDTHFWNSLVGKP